MNWTKLALWLPARGRTEHGSAVRLPDVARRGAEEVRDLTPRRNSERLVRYPFGLAHMGFLLV